MIPAAESPERSKLSAGDYDGMSLGSALRVYFADNGFGEDGGYTDALGRLQLWPDPVPFGNTASRGSAPCAFTICIW
jgi:hypothetical protein